MATPAELLRRLMGQGGVLVGTVLLGVLGGALYGTMKTPTYTADAHVVVVAAAPADDTTAVKFAQAYGRIATDAAVLAGTPTGRAGQGGELRRQVRVATSPDAPLIEVTGSAPDPARAAQVANEVAGSLIAFGNARSAQTRVRVASFAQASVPDRPTSPNRPLAIAVGAAAGVLVGGFAATAGIGAPRRPAPAPSPRPDPAPAVNGTAVRPARLAPPVDTEPGERR